jgi:transcription elongation factor SPT5
VGVIVRLEKENFLILNMYDKLQTVKHQSVQKRKFNKFAVALDSENNTLSVNDIVKVIDGPHLSRQGQIKYLYRHFVFIHSKTYKENGGIFVCTSKHLSLATSNRSHNIQPGFMSPRITSPRHGDTPVSNGNTSSHGGSTVGKSPRTAVPQQRGTRRDATLIGQTIRITQGPYKGYIGMVKDATDTTVRVELHTKCQTITVDRVRISVVGGQKPSVRTPSINTPLYGQPGSQTPMAAAIGSRTPMYGSQTPLYDGSRTPHYSGSATPRHDGSATPNASSVWDPTSTTTPREDFESEDYWDDAPASNNNPNTPGYQAETPDNHAPFTPGSALNFSAQSPYSQHNPSPLDTYHQLYSNQVPTPGSNYGSTASPATSYQNYLFSPATPGGYFAPQTPGANVTSKPQAIGLDLSGNE